jgi:Double-GTPase 1
VKLAALGEFATGKSTYAVVLYGALVNNGADPMGLVDVLDEVGFLNRGLEELAANRRVPRTDSDTEGNVRLRMSSPGGELIVDLPDRSGERLRMMINGRAWDRDLQAAIGELDGALLFLHVMRFDPGRPAEELDLLLAGPEPSQPDPNPAEEDPVPWEPPLMPSDVRAVDLLQALLTQRAAPLPLAVVLSAWDCTSSEHPPAAWLAANAPLLVQFLDTHKDELPYTVFGVSAQGFDFNNPDNAGSELAASDPWDRASVLDGDGANVSLGQPLLWLAERQPDGDDNG